MRWIDLTPYDGAKIEILHLIKADNELRCLIVSPVKNYMADGLRWLGFQPLKNNSTWISQAQTVDIDRFLQVFPDLKTIEVEASQVTRTIDQRPRSPEPNNIVNQDNSAIQATPLGQNTPEGTKLIYNVGGYMVREYPDGLRVYRNFSGDSPYIGWRKESTDGFSPKAYLRASSPNVAVDVIMDHFRRAIGEIGDPTAIARVQSEDHIDLLNAIGLDPKDQKTADIWNGALINWAKQRATSPRHGLNLKTFYDLTSRLVFPGSQSMSAPIAIALFRTLRSLPRNDRNRTITVWNPMFNEVMDSRAVTMPEYKENKQFQDGRLAILDLTKRNATVDPVTIDGITVDRADKLDLLSVLNSRAPDGKTFVLWREDSQNIGDEENFWRDLACRYTVEGRVWLDNNMMDFGTDRAVIFILGGRRPEILDEPHEASMRRREAKGWQDLWSWTSDVMVNREKIRKYYDNSGSDIRNTLQVAYEPLSKAYSNEMVPKNLEHSIRNAQKKFAERHSDIDQYVADLLGMTRQELLDSKIYSASQVDAIGLFNDAFERGYRGVANFDQTGMGKGRFCAAMARIAATRKIPGKGNIHRAIIFTESASNIDDLIKDLRDTKTIDLEGIKVGVVNPNVVTKNHLTREEENFSVPTDVMRDAIENKKWPEGYNILIVSYTQFNQLDFIPDRDAGRGRRRKKKVELVENTNLVGKRVRWLKAVSDENTALIRDESHNGAVNSATGKNLLEATKKAGVIVDSSGSYARTIDEIVQYGHLFPPSVAKKDMVAILRRGGEPVIAAMIGEAVNSGNVIRREHNATRRISVLARPTEAEAEEYRLKKDAMAAVLSEISYMSGYTNERVNETNNQLIESYLTDNPALVATLNRMAMADQRNSVDRIIGTLPTIKMRNIGSARAAIAFLFVSSLTVKKTVDLAIDCLQRGRKPIIVVENTGEAVIKAMAEAGDEDTKIDLQFRDMLYRLVRNSITGYVDEKQSLDVEGAAAKAELEYLEKLLRSSRKREFVLDKLDTYVRRYIENNNLETPVVNNAADSFIEDDPAAHAGFAENNEEINSIDLRITEKKAALIIQDLKKRVKKMRKDVKRRKFLATTQQPETMRGYIGSKARRILLANPDIANISANEDIPAFIMAVHAAMDDAAKLSIQRGYAESAYITPLLDAMKVEVASIISADQKSIKEQVNDPESGLSRLMPVLPVDLAAYLVRVEDMIDAIPDTPCNVIDEIKNSIRAAGYTIGEITGRTIEVVDGVVRPRTDLERNETRDRFNGYGDRLNALVANKTGLTGLNFNSCELFPDKDPRSIIMHEIMRDTIRAIQADGRIARMNNITDPEVIIPLLDLVCQQYLIAMADKKLATWSAGITANSKNALAIGEVVDMFNIIGDHVATTYLLNNRDLATKLSMTMTTDEQENNPAPWRARLNNPDNNGDGNFNMNAIQQNMVVSQRQGVNNRAIQEAEMALFEGQNGDHIETVDGQEVLVRHFAEGARGSRVFGGRTKINSGINLLGSEGRPLYRMSTLIQKMIMLPDAEERMHMAALQCEFEAAVAELDAQGKNPMRTQFIDAKVHVIESVPLSGIEGEVNIPGDPIGNGFSAPVRLERVAFEYYTQPIRSNDLEQIISQRRDLSEYYSQLIDQSEENDMRWLRSMPNLTIEEEIETVGKGSKLYALREEANNVRWAVLQIKPGRRIDLAIDSERRIGIVTNITATLSMYHKLSSYNVSFVVPGDTNERTVNLKTLMADEKFDVLPGLESDLRDEVLNEFDASNDSRRVTRRLMLNGNLWRIMAFIQEYRIGHLVSWNAPNGTIQRGVLLNREIGDKLIPTPVVSGQVIEYMANKSKISTKLTDIAPKVMLENGRVQKSTLKGFIKIECITKPNGDKVFDFHITSNMKEIVGNPEIFALIMHGTNANSLTKKKSLTLLNTAIVAGLEVTNEQIIDVIKHDLNRKLNSERRMLANQNLPETVRDHTQNEINVFTEKLSRLEDPEIANAEAEAFRNNAKFSHREYNDDDHVSAKSEGVLRSVLELEPAKKMTELLIAAGIDLYGTGHLRSAMVTSLTPEDDDMILSDEGSQEELDLDTDHDQDTDENPDDEVEQNPEEGDTPAQAA